MFSHLAVEAKSNDGLPKWNRLRQSKKHRIVLAKSQATGLCADPNEQEPLLPSQCSEPLEGEHALGKGTSLLPVWELMLWIGGSPGSTMLTTPRAGISSCKGFSALIPGPGNNRGGK